MNIALLYLQKYPEKFIKYLPKKLVRFQKILILERSLVLFWNLSRFVQHKIVRSCKEFREEKWADF